MNKNDINQGLYAPLVAGMTVSGAFPGVDETPERPFKPPYYEVAFAGVQRETNLDGSIRNETGTLVVTIADIPGKGEAEANNFADAVKAIFPGALRLPISGGLVTIIGTPNIRGGYPADAEYRVPVDIRYMATQA